MAVGLCVTVHVCVHGCVCVLCLVCFSTCEKGFYGLTLSQYSCMMSEECPIYKLEQ